MVFSSKLCYKVYNIMWLQNLNQKHSNDVSRMSIKTFMIFLSLKNIYQIPSLHRDACDIMDLILSLFFMIWWIRNLEVLLISLIIDAHKTKLREAMLKTNSIKSNWSDLNSDGTLSWSSRIDLWELRFFDDKFSHCFLCMCISLTCLFLSQFCDFKWS